MMTRLNNFFEAGSPFLNHPLLTAERTAVETNFIEAQLHLPAGARILDVGCGFGRHSIELARRGYVVTGIDPAAAMIAAAQEQAREANVAVDFRQTRGEDFTTDILYDAAICLFTSLGQMGPDGDNSSLVQRVYEALKPGGLFMVELPQRDTAVTQLRPSDKFGDGEQYTAVTRQYNPADQTITETFRLIAPEETRTYTLHYRLYSRAALETLLTQSGFTIQAAYSDYTGAPLADDAATMILIGGKRD
ncbi:MAG TPA: class I SAM-dependent methyltransferase [Anaerolineae bacterium]|nr:class I SAM-dependent methyltransferase [Anaerolineae bacterium]